MALNLPQFPLDEGLDLRELQTTGSSLHLNIVYEDSDFNYETTTKTTLDFIGKPVQDFKLLAEKMTALDPPNGFVKKKIMKEGSGLPPDSNNTISIAFSGYMENVAQPFDSTSPKKPLEVDLDDSGLLPGLEMAVKSMLVGELSVFLFSHEVMYGELGIPPRIKPKAQCVFYIELIKSIVTSKSNKINFSEPNMFPRVHKEVQKLYLAGYTYYKSSNFSLAISMFRRAIFMLHKCRLADENEEQKQEKMLKKLYFNLALCYNKTKQPLKACTACNELNRLQNLWNNGKALFQNAKALRMIGVYDYAEKMLKRAMKLVPDNADMKDEMELLFKSRESCIQATIIGKQLLAHTETVNENFREHVDLLIKNFKENDNVQKFTLPGNLGADEMAYIKEACIRENLFFNELPKCFQVKDNELVNEQESKGDLENVNYLLEKEQEVLCDLNTEVEKEKDEPIEDLIIF